MLSQELTQFSLNSRNEHIPLLIGRRRNPKFSFRSGPKSALTRPSSTGQLTAPNMRSINRLTTQTLGLTENVDPTQLDFSSLSISVNQTVDRFYGCQYFVHVSRPMFWQSLKTLFSLFLFLSLYSPSR